MKYDGPLFKNLRADKAMMMRHGFAKVPGGFAYEAPLMGGAFKISVAVGESGEIDFRVSDSETGEEYPPAYMENAKGAFVTKVRGECERALADIAEKCFVPGAFKSAQAQAAISYIEKKFGAKPEYLWKKFPNNAVFRERKSSKWFTALLSVERRKIGIGGDGIAEILDLKAGSEEISGILDGKACLPGYHMNKRHWFSIVLDGSVPDGEIMARIDRSFAKVAGGNA